MRSPETPFHQRRTSLERLGAEGFQRRRGWEQTRPRLQPKRLSPKRKSGRQYPINNTSRSYMNWLSVRARSSRVLHGQHMSTIAGELPSRPVGGRTKRAAPQIRSEPFRRRRGTQVMGNPPSATPLQGSPSPTRNPPFPKRFRREMMLLRHVCGQSLPTAALNAADPPSLM